MISKQQFLSDIGEYSGHLIFWHKNRWRMPKMAVYHRLYRYRRQGLVTAKCRKKIRGKYPLLRGRWYLTPKGAAYLNFLKLQNHKDSNSYFFSPTHYRTIEPPRHKTGKKRRQHKGASKRGAGAYGSDWDSLLTATSETNKRIKNILTKD